MRVWHSANLQSTYIWSVEVYLYLFKIFTPLSDSLYVTFTIHFNLRGKYNSNCF